MIAVVHEEMASFLGAIMVNCRSCPVWEVQGERPLCVAYGGSDRMPHLPPTWVETRRAKVAVVCASPVCPLAIPAIGERLWVFRSLIPQRLTDAHGTLDGKSAQNGP